MGQLNVNSIDGVGGGPVEISKISATYSISTSGSCYMDTFSGRIRILPDTTSSIIHNAAVTVNTRVFVSAASDFGAASKLWVESREGYFEVFLDAAPGIPVDVNFEIRV